MNRIMVNVLHQSTLLISIISWIASIPVREQSRLSIVDWTNYNDFEPQGPGTYAFGYDIEDPETNNVQFRDEERFPNGTVIGSYGYVKPDGNIFVVRYVADEKGYRATVEDSSKGQLKYPTSFYGSSSRRTPESSILASALQSNEVYKKQTIHEQRTRPADKIFQSNRRVFSSPVYSVREEHEDRHGNDVEQSWLFDEGRNYNVEPLKFYIYRN